MDVNIIKVIWWNNNSKLMFTSHKYNFYIFKSVFNYYLLLRVFVKLKMKFNYKWWLFEINDLINENVLLKMNLILFKIINNVHFENILNKSIAVQILTVMITW